MSARDGLADFLVEMPKVELHVHLEGSILPATLLSLAKRHGVDLPADDEAGLRRWFQFDDFEEFVEIYLTCSSCLRDPEDFLLLARDFLAEQARQNVLYSEVHFTVSTHLANGARGDELADALAEAMEEGRKSHGVEMRLITDIVRNAGFRAADRTIEWALDHRRRAGVVALGLSGFESWPDEPFESHFRTAAAEDLRRVAHAGEHGGPESIRSVRAVCGAERIGHGVAAARDPELMAELAVAGVPLEVCPSSNVCLGVAPSLAEHPLPRLLEAGLEVSIHSDDPPLFDTTLSGEYERVGEAFGWSADELAGLALAALEHSFLPEERRRELAGELRARMAQAGERHLGRTVRPRRPGTQG